MTSGPCTQPLELGALAAYHLGELSRDAEQSLEEHYFSCDDCARRLSWVETLTRAIAEVVRAGRVSSNVSAAWVARAAAEGVRLRSYELGPGQSVECTASPDDDLVITRLRVPPELTGAVEIETEWTDLEAGRSERREVGDVFVDSETHELLYVFPGDLIRSYPRSRWVLHVRPRGSEQRIGPYTMNHTPWEQLRDA